MQYEKMIDFLMSWKCEYGVIKPSLELSRNFSLIIMQLGNEPNLVDTLDLPKSHKDTTDGQSVYWEIYLENLLGIRERGSCQDT